MDTNFYRKIERAYKMKSQYLRNEDLSGNIENQLDLDIDSWLEIVDQFIAEQNFQKAQDSIRMALCINPYCAKLWITLGNLQATLHQYDDAEKSYLEALKINPIDDLAKNNLHSLQIRQNQ